jgi:hypothetical protein
VSPKAFVVSRPFFRAFVATKLRFYADDGKAGSTGGFCGVFWRHKNLKNRAMGLSKAGVR